MLTVVFYRETNRTVPLLTWLDGLPEKARLACIARIELLAQFGHQLRRPHAENLGEGIWELRAKVEGVNYRLLYFFHGQQVVVLTHGITKQRATVPPIEIERAKQLRAAFEADPAGHTHKE
jgi:phage-related protein